MNYLILTIDLGATSSRGILRRQELGSSIEPGIIFSHKVRSETFLNSYGLLEERADDALREMFEKIPREYKSQIKAIVTVSHGATQILLDREGEPLFGACSYDSPAFDDTHDEFLEKFGGTDALFLETGSPEFPRGINALQQVYWVRKNFPDRFAPAVIALPLSSYIAYRLTGNRFTDRTHTRNHAYIERIVPEGFEYSSAVKGLGIVGLFPPARKSFEPYGTVSDIAALEYGLPAGCLAVAAGHDTSVIASLAENLASTGTWICNVSRGRSIELESHMQAKGLLVNADIYGSNLRTTIARLGQMRERYIETFRERSGEDIPDDLPFDKIRLADKAMIKPGFTDSTGPYPSPVDELIEIPATLLADPGDFFHELAFSLAVQEALSSIFASDPSVSMKGETLLSLLSKNYRAPALTMGGPFAGNYVDRESKDSGELNLFLEYFRRLYPGPVSRFGFEEPTSFAAHWMGVAAVEGRRPDEIDHRLNLPLEDVSYSGDVSPLMKHLEVWESVLTSGR